MTRYGTFWVREPPSPLVLCSDNVKQRLLFHGDRTAKAWKCWLPLVPLYIAAYTFSKVRHSMCINSLGFQDYVWGMWIFEPNTLNTEYFFPMPFIRIFDHMHWESNFSFQRERKLTVTSLCLNVSAWKLLKLLSSLCIRGRRYIIWHSSSWGKIFTFLLTS